MVVWQFPDNPRLVGILGKTRGTVDTGRYERRATGGEIMTYTEKADQASIILLDALGARATFRRKGDPEGSNWRWADGVSRVAEIVEAAKGMSAKGDRAILLEALKVTVETLEEGK